MNIEDEKILIQLFTFLTDEKSIWGYLFKNFKNLNIDTSIQEDIRYTGDDAFDLIEEYSKIFRVNIDDFEFSKYFLQETNPIYIDAFFKFFGIKNYYNLKPFTVRNLLEGIKKGKLE